MSPIEIQLVNSTALYVLCVAWLALVIGVIIAIFCSKDTATTNKIGTLGLIALVAGGVLIFGTLIYQAVEKSSAYAEFMDRLESESGMEIVNTDQYDYSDIADKNTVLPITLRHEGNLVEANIVIENSVALIYVPESIDGKTMVPLGEEQW